MSYRTLKCPPIQVLYPAKQPSHHQYMSRVPKGAEKRIAQTGTFIDKRAGSKQKRLCFHHTGAFRLQKIKLNSAGNLTRTEATGTYMHMLGRTVHNRLNPLYIGFPGAVAAAVGVGNPDTEDNALVTKITFGHSLEPPRWSG